MDWQDVDASSQRHLHNMRHEISDYTDGDLAVAIRSPFNSITRQYELEAEINKREYERESNIKYVKRFIATS